MTIHLNPELESALIETARFRGVAQDALALDALCERFLAGGPVDGPRDEWERLLLGVATDCGMSLPDSALSSDGLYEPWPI